MNAPRSLDEDLVDFAAGVLLFLCVFAIGVAVVALTTVLVDRLLGYLV